MTGPVYKNQPLFGFGFSQSLEESLSPPVSREAPASARALVGFLHDLHNLRHGDSAGRTPSFLIKLSTELQKPHPDPTKVLRDLSGEERAAFESLVGAGSMGTWLSLSGAGDVGALYQGLLALGKGLKNQGELEQAQAYLSLLAQARPGVAIPKEVQNEAKLELNAMTGCGDGWRRAGYLAGRFWDEAMDVRTIVPIMLGTVVYEGVKGLTLARWGERVRRAEFFQKTVPWYMRGRRAELSASAVAFVPELGVFGGLGHVMHGGEGSLAESMWRNGITLSVLKSFGFMGRGLVEGYLGSRTWARVLVPQGAVFAGLYSARLLEEQLDPSLRVDGATRAVDTLGTMASLGLGMYLGRKAIPYLERLHRRLAMGAKYYAEQLRQNLAAVRLPGRPVLAAGFHGPIADGIWYSRESQPDIREGSLPPPEPLPAAQSGLVAKVATSRMRGYKYVTTQVAGVYAIKEVIAGVPDTCRCLFLHILSRPPVVLVAALKDAPGSFVIPGRSLKEVHLMFVDGTIYRLQIGDPGAKVSMEPPSKKVSFEDTHLPEESIVRQRLLPLWSNWSDPHKKAQDLFAYVKRLIDLSGVDLEVFLGRLSSDPRLGAQYGSGGLRWEDLAPKGQGASLPFSLLSILAEYCREDVRRHIIVSDSRHFQQWWKPELWGTEHYPFYLEAEDIAVLEYFSRQQGDAYRRTFGWLLLSGRKDPFNYHNYADLMGTLGLPQEAIVALETNQAIPELTTVLRLSNELDTPMPQWVDALKRTFSREQLPHWVTEFRPTAKTRS